MLCERPYKSYGTEFRCYQCVPCRIYVRRVWTHRMILESYSHKENCFGTFTYPDETRPVSLTKKHFQDFVKRFRNVVASDFRDARIRLFYSGEYGDQSGNAHYHAIIFGYPSCELGGTRYRAVRGSLRFECCDTCRRLHDAWQFGKIDNGTATVRSCQYVARYVNKKMTSRDDVRLNGREPEFVDMSRRPGIGVPYVRDVLGPVVARYISRESDIPVTLQHGGKHWPLGRTLRAELRKFLGINAKKDSYDGLQDVPGFKEFLAQKPSNQQVSEYLSAFDFAKREAAALAKVGDEQRILNLKAREGVFKKRSSI